MANRLMVRAFTMREKVLLLIAAVLALGALYYFGVVKNVADTEAGNAQKLEEIGMQIEAQQALANQYAAMQRELDALGSTEGLPVVEAYDNVRNELDELNRILAPTATFSMTFEDPVQSDKMVRRAVKISYTVSDYDAAFGIVESLQGGKYRSQVNDVSMTGKLLANGGIESVSTTLTVTFFETTDGASTTDGLVSATK